MPQLTRPSEQKTSGGQQITSFPANAFAISPDDNAVYSSGFFVYVGTAGNVSVIPENGSASVVFQNLPDGAVVPCRVKAVLAGSTTASNLVGIY